ncbi:membrane-spanning 4-domains subfamily A member 4A-like [Vicugna pacos]|uniref:Membrane-spanning 4-domains subfamily A member 4A-like n=1 Tax=Vicugna pacos TaxID=30538 RepID=A0ABM5E1B3_VICPA
MTRCLGVTVAPFFPHADGFRLYIITKIYCPVWGSVSIQGSLGMNTVSAIIAVLGTYLAIQEEIILWQEITWKYSHETVFLIARLTGMLVLFLMEVCAALSLSIFGCRVACSINNVVVLLPNNDNKPSAVSPEHDYEEVTVQ